MDYTFTWGEGPEDVRVETSGAIDVDALDAMVEEALADPRFRPGMRVLVDHTRATWAGVDGAEVRRRVELVRAQADRIGRQRVAFVVAGRVDLGVARMLAAYAADGIAFDFRVFPTVPAAREWLSARP
jgi:hypothetical protein